MIYKTLRQNLPQIRTIRGLSEPSLEVVVRETPLVELMPTDSHFSAEVLVRGLIPENDFQRFTPKVLWCSGAVFADANPPSITEWIESALNAFAADWTLANAN